MSTPVVDGLCIFSTYNGMSLRLNWNPVDGDFDGMVESVLDGVSGYNVYRGLSEYSPFTKINSSVIQGLTLFHTPTASFGWRRNENVRNEYWFAVTSVDALGESSRCAPRTFHPTWAFDNAPTDGLSDGVFL